MQIIFFILIGALTNPIFASPSDKLTKVSSPKEALEIYNEIKAQGNIPNITEIMQKHPSEDISKLLGDINLSAISGYPQETKLFRVMSVVEGSIYDIEGIKAGQLVRTN